LHASFPPMQLTTCITRAIALAATLALACGSAVLSHWTASNDGAVMKAPLAGGAATTLALLQSYPTGIAVDDASVYWTNYAGARSCALGSVMKVAIGGGRPITLASNQLYPDGIAVDATSVYWTTGVSRDLTVYDGAVMKLTPK
jgi:sugar lactone lactonase YvrE